MKKQLICMLAAAAMLPGATVFAAGSYDESANTVTINDSTKKTVMIARNTGTTMKTADIVYVGQENNGFSGASFMIKENPAVGFYTIMMGGDGDVTKSTFFIGSTAGFKDQIKLTALPDYEVKDGNTVTKAYVSADSVTLDNAKSVVVTYKNEFGNDTSVCEELGTVTSGGGNVRLAVKLEGIPADYKDSVNVFISSTEISTKDLITK